MMTSARATCTVTNSANVCPVPTVTHTTRQTGQPIRFVPILFPCVDLVYTGKFHADSTIFKYFKAKFVVLFHVFLFLGNCPPLAVIGI